MNDLENKKVIVACIGRETGNVDNSLYKLLLQMHEAWLDDLKDDITHTCNAINDLDKKINDPIQNQRDREQASLDNLRNKYNKPQRRR